jgi:hypothetical protein
MALRPCPAVLCSGSAQSTASCAAAVTDCMRCALPAAVCPLQEDLQWRQQLADVTGPPDQDALPPLDRKVRSKT